ncbi:MAG: sugar phosphate isomerase/epimerase family protein [Gemmatimonadales bacterium]
MTEGRGASRREFLRAGLGALIACRVRREGPEQDGPSGARLDRIGIQLYTVRREFARDPEATLARVSEIGFREVEFVGYPPGTPQEIRQLLERYRLQAPSSHVGLRAADAEWERTLDTAGAIGQRYVVVAGISPTERRSADGWKRIAARFNQAGEAARKRGLQFCYHNHDFEFESLDGMVPYDLLLAETDAALVRLELDLYWITKGGRDPLDYFAKWPGRFPLVHVKDMDGTPRRFFTEVGKGTIDFARIFRRANRGGIQHYFYEQDETSGSPFESARASYDYLRTLRY